MDWSEEGIVLAARAHGEGGAILSLLTESHGRHLGLVRGAKAPKSRALYEPGNRLIATWRGRLEEHLGSYACELLTSPAALWLEDPARLEALATATLLVDRVLPEREPHAALFAGLSEFIARLGDEDWPARYVRLELLLLAELGFGLDLTRCAATGGTQDLAYVSPKTGRAVSRDAAGPWRERLLPLPAFLLGQAEARPEDILAGLQLTGYFLALHLFDPARPMPAQRQRLLDRMARAATISGMEKPV
jgi:DNA repair protein RecO (recombination protein O)